MELERVNLPGCHSSSTGFAHASQSHMLADKSAWQQPNSSMHQKYLLNQDRLPVIVV